MAGVDETSRCADCLENHGVRCSQHAPPLNDKERAYHLGEIRGWVLRSGHESDQCQVGICHCRRQLALEALRALGVVV